VIYCINLMFHRILVLSVVDVPLRQNVAKVEPLLCFGEENVDWVTQKGHFV